MEEPHNAANGRPELEVLDHRGALRKQLLTIGVDRGSRCSGTDEAMESLRSHLVLAATPVVLIQPMSDCACLKVLRSAQGKFQESKRLYDLSRNARQLRDLSEPGRVRLRVMRPRVQMCGLEKRVAEAYGKLAMNSFQ